jgi:tripartite-type tricarboxylate transporter receptor subunit TctC
MRTRAAFLILATLLALTTTRSAVADDDYPKRTIRLIVPFTAGSGPDQIARLLGQYLQETMGQTVVVEDHAGALGSIAAQEVARSAPDGYTLLLGTNTTHASNVAMLKNLSYDPVKDFAPIIRTSTTAQVLLVKPDFPAQTLAEFMTYARAHPGLTAGFGSGAAQISIAQLQSRGGLSLVTASYRGIPQAVADVMGGVISLSFADLSVSIPQMRGGTLRGIGVTSPERNELIPDLPALAEAMPGFRTGIWYGLFAPAHTPGAIVNKLHAVSEKFLTLPATRDKLAAVGVSTAPLPPAEFSAFVRGEIARWTADAKEAGIEAN